MKISLIATERKTGKVFHLSGMWVCTEYDSICFALDESSHGEQYPHLAGRSSLPNDRIEDYSFTVAIEDAKQTEDGWDG